MIHQRKYHIYKAKYLNLKQKRAMKLVGGHYLEIPEKLSQYDSSDYYHPHDLGITFTNDDFMNNVIKRESQYGYILKEYIKLSQGNQETLSILMNSDVVLNLLLTFARLKSIVQNLEFGKGKQGLITLPQYVKNITESQHNVLRRMGNPDILSDLQNESLYEEGLWDTLKTTVQLLLVHITNYVAKNKQMPQWATENNSIKKFIELTFKFNNYKNSNNSRDWSSQMIYLENKPSNSFLLSFGNSLKFAKQLFELNLKLIEQEKELSLN